MKCANPKPAFFLRGRRTHGARKQNAAQQNNFCLNNPATETAEVCCNGLLFTHSTNFARPYFVLVCHKNIFGEAVLRPLACCALGQLPPLLPSGAARGKGGSFPLWVDVQKLCNMCVLSLSWNFFVSHDKYIARPSSKEPR